MNKFKTAAEDSTFQITVKNSEFIGNCFFVSTVENVYNHLNRVRRLRAKATHNCYAYRLFEKGAEKACDDGEPGGTAGVPILQTIKSRDLFDVLIVVTRYFGGTKLGASGLLRAYSDCSSKLLENTLIKEMILTNNYSFECGYKTFEAFQKYTAAKPYLKLDSTQFFEKVNLTVDCKKEFEDEFLKDVEEFTKNKMGLVLNCSRFIFWD